MAEFFEFLKHLETPLSTTPSRQSPTFGTTIRDKIFKIVILVLLLFSIMIQVLVSAWFCDKLETLENRLSLHPVSKPVEVDVKVTLPELVEVDRKIDGFVQELDKERRTQQAILVPEGKTKIEIPSAPVRAEAKPRRSNRVEVVEKIKN